MRQSTLFNMLRSIRFYKYYLHSKCFNLWRSNVRYKLYCQQRKKIAHGLFLAKESFCAPLLELKTHMLELQQVKLLDLSSKSPFDCSVFVEVQQTKRQDASKLFDSCMEKVAAVVQRVCSDVTSLARSADAQESPLDQLARHGARPEEQVDGRDQAGGGRPAQHAAARRAGERRMLADFVRLADYVAVESLVNLTVKANSGVPRRAAQPAAQGGALRDDRAVHRGRHDLQPDVRGDPGHDRVDDRLDDRDGRQRDARALPAPLHRARRERREGPAERAGDRAARSPSSR